MTNSSDHSKHGKRRRALQRKSPSPLALEARIMFDGAAVDTAAAVASAADHPQPGDSAVDVAASESAAVSSAVTAQNTEAASKAPPEATAAATDSPASTLRVLTPGDRDVAGGRSEIVFVDPVVANWPSLVEQIKPGIEVVLLDRNIDGLAQIASYLDGRHDIDAIHILGHGEAGQLDLAASHLDAAALNSQAVADTLRAIGSHLSADGDILLYGCDIAASTEGAALVTQIAALTSADVAASTNDTGSAALGGDWLLESHTGNIETNTLDLSAANSPAFLLGAPTVTSVDDRTYTEGSGAVVVDSDITITGGVSYDGKYVRFSLTNGQTTDVLGINNAANVNASGAISVVGSTVYMGNGSSRDAIGTIDAVENGQAGKALKINFVSTFTNSSFENGITGWTAMNQRIDLGVTSIAGFVSPTDPTNPSNSGGHDNNVPTTLGTLQTVVSTTQATDGTKSLQLSSTGMTTRNGFDVVHGPAVYSDVFSAAAGDAIYFDWRALAGSDAYDVFGYLLNTVTGATTTVLNATGTSASGTTNWATASATIPTSGTYRFVFVSGTYDFSGGRAAGASLYIDNVRVFGSKVNDAVVTNIARQVTFEATSDAPETASTRVFTVTAASSTGHIGTDTGLININSVNDAPTLTGTAQVLSYTENQLPTAIDTQIVVADPDLPANFNGGYLEVQITANGAAEDNLSVLHQGNGAGQIGVSGSNITFGGVVIGSIDPSATGAANGVLRIALNANATVAATQALARAIAYSNSSDAPSTASRTVTYRLNDGGNRGSGGALTGTRTATVNVTAVDDPTVMTLTRDSATYIENDGSFYVDAGVTLTDVDSTTLNGAKVIIAGNFRSGQDQLVPAGGTNADGITFAYDASRGVLTLSGTATVAQYEAALRSVRYNNTSDNPDVSPRTITMTIGNVVALTIGGVNHYYEVVSGPLSWTAAKLAAENRTFQGMTGYLATLTSQAENDFVREKLIADAWMGASDDYLLINAATGTTTYANQAAAEGHWYWVTGPEKGSRISDGNGNPVTVNGSYSYWNSGEPNNSGSEHYGQIYSTGAAPGRWNDLPNSSQLAYVVEYSDNGGTPSFSKSVVVTPQRVNDAPVTSGSVVLTSINEDARTNSGQLVSSFLSATDPDTDPVTGIAITTLASSRGTWQYSLDNGATWAAVGAVNDNSALLLRATDRIRFVPDGQNADTASITYRAWDRSNENNMLAAGVKTDVSSNGGITAYSSGTQTGNITVTAVNDAPVLAADSPALTGINEDAIANGGQTLASLLGSSVSDVDNGAQQGVAITGLNSGNGTWEYSINGGSTWIAVGTVAGNSALLLRDTDYIRFRPDGKNGTAASFTYKAWDRTSGSQGGKVDTTVSGGTTAFSTAANTASITVTAVNDAPVLSGAALNFATITEDDANSAGQTVASLLGNTLTDVDNGAAQGIAITGATVAGSGHWEYDTGSGWTTLGTVSGSSSMLLRATDKLRYVPDLQHGGTPTLTVRGWDTSTGTAGSTADTTLNGGTTAFSTATSTASISVTEINDAPVFNTAASASSFTEAGSPVAVGANLVLTDDGANLKGATVRIADGFTAGDTLAVGTPGGLTVSYNASTGVLTLSGTASVATYQAALRSVTFVTASEDPTVNATTRTLEWRATDSANLTSAASTSTLSVTPTADAPVLNGVPATWGYVEDDGTRVVAPTLLLSDVDDTHLSGATMTISGTGYLNDGFELLAAVTTGTSITASFDGSTGILTLSGTDSVANYQKVLRSVTYTNMRDYNNPSAIPSNDFVLDGTSNTRSFSWQVVDANSDGANGAPAYGPQSSAPVTTTVTLYNANEVPQVTDVIGGTSHISYIEGGVPATLEGLLTVHDDTLTSTIDAAFVRVTAGLEAGDQLGFFAPIMGWTQTGTPTDGTWDDGGGKVIAYSWSVATGDMTLTTISGSTDQNDYTIIMQSVGFVSTSDDPTASNPTRSLIWRVTDSFGEQSAVTAAQTTIIDITAIDDAPTLAGLPAGGAVVFIEDGADVVAAPGLILSDVDDTKVLSATVVLSGTGFLPANEYLSLPGAVASAGSDWSASNIGGSGIDASYSSATGTLILTAANADGVDIATMQALLRQVRYGSVDNDPTVSAPTRTLTWAVTDVFGSRITDVPSGNDSEAGATSTPVVSTITLAPRNDAPTLSGAGAAASYTEGGSAVTLLSGVTAADIDDASLSGASVWISGGFTAGDVLSVGTPGGLAVTYDSSTGVLSLSGTASKAVYDSALRSIRFSSVSDDPTAIASSRNVSWTVTDANAAGDGAQTSNVLTSSVNITAADDAASIGGLGSVNFTENGSTVAVAPTATLTDADDTTLEGLTVTISAGRTTGDLLVVGADLSATGITVTSYNSATGELVLSGTASLADYQAALRSIVFSSNSDDPAAISTTRTLTWSTISSFASRLTDADAGNDASAGVTAASAGSSTITITALNDAPVIALDDGTPDPDDAPVFQQGSVPVYALQVGNTAGGITITDADSGDTIVNASVQITGNLLSSDVLSIATPGGWTQLGNTFTKGGTSIVVAYNSGTGTLSLTGTATRGDYQELLGSVQFSNGSLAPTASGGSRELTWSVTDSNSAGDGARTATGTSLLTIRDINDAPTILPISGSASYTEGDLVVELPDIVISDPDPDEIVTATLTLSPASVGALSVPPGSSYNAGTGVWTMTGTVDAVNAALAALQFLPETDNDVPASIAIVVTDGGEDGVISATGTITLNVTGVNDAPVLTPVAPVLGGISEDDVNNAGYQVGAFRGGITDVDSGTNPGIVITALGSGNGHWEYSLNGGSSWTTVTGVSDTNALLLRDADRLRFVPNGQNGTAATVTYRGWDGTGGSAGAYVNASSTGNAQPFSNAFDVASLTVSSVNDAPVLAAGNVALPSITEDDTAEPGHLIADLLAGLVTDVDSGATQGIAITGLNAGNGAWQYSLDGGNTWINVGAVTGSSALLLRDSDYIRFMPDARNGTLASFNYRAWDRTTGSAGTMANIAGAGGSWAFSGGQNTISLTVTDVNDAPVNDVRPTISGGDRVDGTLRQDGVLVANPQLWHDVDAGDPPVSFRYEWEIADDAAGTNLQIISGATQDEYRVIATDIGKYIRVRVYGSDGQVEIAADSVFNLVTNQGPSVGTPLPTQQTMESVPLHFTIPPTSFVDLDGEDTLYYSATLVDGSPLPAWLSFDPVTRTFTGTPGGGDVGVVSVRVTVGDNSLTTASSDFVLRVLALPVNQADTAPPAAPPAPPLAPNMDLSSPVATSDGAVFLQTPAARALGIDTTGDSLGDRYRQNDAVEPLTSASGFRIPVDASPTGDRGLALAHPLTDQYTKSDRVWHFTVPSDTFVHTQNDAVIVLQAARIDGSPLPSWLRFDARSGKFTGEPPEDFEGVIEIRVTARDNQGNEVSTILRIHIKKHVEKPLAGRSGLSSQFAAQLHERAAPREALVRPIALPRVRESA